MPLEVSDKGEIMESRAVPGLVGGHWWCAWLIGFPESISTLVFIYSVRNAAMASTPAACQAGSLLLAAPLGAAWGELQHDWNPLDFFLLETRAQDLGQHPYSTELGSTLADTVRTRSATPGGLPGAQSTMLGHAG